jgi:hypothetical protein
LRHHSLVCAAHNSDFATCLASGRMRRPRAISIRNTDLYSDAFDPAEIAELADLCARCPAERWARRRGPAGEDVIEIELGGDRPGSMKLRKADGAYAVTGFGGWRLAIFADLTALIAALADRLRPRAPEPLALPDPG